MGKVEVTTGEVFLAFSQVFAFVSRSNSIKAAAASIKNFINPPDERHFAASFDVEELLP